jgi:hypothetical protein
MNTPTPTPTPRTDAATYPADCLGKTLVTNRDCSRALERELVTLTGACTCTHHNDQQRAACPVCLVTALTAERDQLRAENSNLRAGQKACEACDEPTAFEVRKLRAEMELLRFDAEEFRENAIARAERAEADLAELHASFAGNVHAERNQLRDRLAAAQQRETIAIASWDEERNRALREGERVVEWRDRAYRAEAALAAEREKVRMLRAALENLCDEQNGAPLETRRDEWQLAMDEARAALAATEGAK